MSDITKRGNYGGSIYNQKGKIPTPNVIIVGFKSDDYCPNQERVIQRKSVPEQHNKRLNDVYWNNLWNFSRLKHIYTHPWRKSEIKTKGYYFWTLLKVVIINEF